MARHPAATPGFPTWSRDRPVERLADGFQFTEGPLWCPDGSLLFQDNKAERTYRLRPRPLGPTWSASGPARPTARRSAPTAASSSASRTAAASRG